jgi:ATP-dependent exoDNAse (exonuclease V) beta subunit
MALLRQEMEALQMEENVRLLQSLNAQIAAVIRENPAPYIYERLGTRYRYLFIDEFQDTSVTQWHNLVPLYHEALASDPRNRTLVVGDAKQAIYRWRNGDYEQLQRLPGLIGTDLPPALLQAQEAFDAQLGTDHLKVNRRSLPAIIAWNNTFFGALQPLLPELLRGVYDDLVQEAWRPGWGDVRVTSRTAKRKGDRDAARNRWLVERIAAHGGGEVRYDGDGEIEKVEWKGGGRPLNEIAILVRKNKEGANIAQYLLSVGISPFTEESLLLGRHPLPLAVVYLMRGILDPEHPGHALGFVQCYCALFPGWDEAQLLFAHAVTRERVRADGKTIGERGMDWKGLLREVCPEMDLARFQIEPLVVLMGHLLEKLDGLRRYAPYAEALLEAANQLKGRGKGGIPGFLKAWEQRLAKSSIRAQAAVNSVQIMTIHKSKGLAFPVVLLPMGFEKQRSFKSEITVRLEEGTYGLPAGIFHANDLKASAEERAFLEEYQRTLLDSVNVAYVGMTRPRDVLEMYFDWEPKSKSKPKIEEEAEELPTVSSLWDRAFEQAFGVGLRPAEEGEERVFHAGPEGGLELLRGRVTWAEGSAGSVSAEAAPGPAAASAEAGPEAEPVRVVQLEGMRVGLPVRQLAVAPERTRWTPEGGRLSARERGKWVHRLLAQLPDRRAWEDVRAEWQASHAMPAADKVDLLEAVDRILSLVPVAPFFEPGAEVHSERAFADAEGQIFIPDRLLCTPTGWAVLDFKTGKPRPDHNQQVARYMQQLTAIASGPVSGWLCYLETGDCVSVAPQLF